MRERWMEGLWLGKRFNSDENVVVKMNDGGVVRTRSVQEMPVQLTTEMVDKNTGQPWQPTTSAKMKEYPDIERSEFNHKEEDDTEKSIPRSMPIMRAMLDKLGYTNSCQQCRMMIRGDSSKTSIGTQRNVEKGLRRQLPRMRSIVRS